MKYCCVLVVQFIYLFLSHSSSASLSDDIASGSGELPLTPNSTVEPTSTSSQHLLVPFSTDVDAPPPSASVYIIPSSSLSLTSSTSDNVLPTSVFGVSKHPIQTVTLTSTSALSPSSSPLSLVSFIINLAMSVVISQSQENFVLGNITRSLSASLSLPETDIHDVRLVLVSEVGRRKRQSSLEEDHNITFSSIVFAVRDIHVSAVALLQEKIRKGGVTVQLSPTEALLLKDIVQSSQSEPDPGGSSLSLGQLVGIIAGIVVLLLIVVASIALIAVKATSRSKESQEIANLRETYGYQYVTTHTTSQWPPHSPLL